METLTDPKDPLGILKKKQAPAEETPSEGDPLGILKKKDLTVEDQNSSAGLIKPASDESTEQSSAVSQDSKKPTGSPIINPLNPTGIGDAFGKSLINFFVNAAPKTIYREAMKTMPSNYEELMKRADQGPTNAEDTGILSMDRIKNTPLKDLLAEYKERAAEEPGSLMQPNKNKAAKETYNILLRASKTSNPTPERVMAFYKDEVNRTIQKSRDKYEKENITSAEGREKALMAGVPQDFTSIKSAGEFKDWLEGSMGQGLASSIAFATVPAVLFKMEKYDALDEIRAKKAESLTQKFGTEITPKSLEKVQTKEENEADENLANTVASISMGLEGLGFLAGAGKAAKAVFFNSAKNQILEEATKYGAKGAIKDIGVAGGGEFATEYVQDVNQQVGALMATGMSLTEALASVNHKRAFNSGMQGLAPGTVFGGITATAKAQTATDVIKQETKNVDPNDVSALDKSAEAIQAKVDASETEVITKTEPKVEPVVQGPEVTETSEAAKEEPIIEPVVVEEEVKTTPQDEVSNLRKEGRISDVDASLIESSIEKRGLTDVTSVIDLADKIFEHDNAEREQSNLSKREGRGLEHVAEAINYETSKNDPDFGRVVPSDITYAVDNPKYDISNGNLGRMESLKILPEEGKADMAEFNKMSEGLNKLRDNKAFPILKRAIQNYERTLELNDTPVGRPLIDHVNTLLKNIEKNKNTTFFKNKKGVKEKADLESVIYDQISKMPELEVTETPVAKEGFTEAAVVNRDYKTLKEKLGEKKTKKYFENADRLINPNKNNIIEYRPNGIVTKEGDKYTFHALADTEFKKWRIASTTDVTDQFTKPEPKEEVIPPAPPEPIQPAAVEEKKPAPKERKFAKQILEDANISSEVKSGLSEDAKTYVPKGISITAQEAKAIIDVKGAEQATSDFLDRTNEMTEDTRAVLGQNLIRHFNEAQDFDSAVKVADNLAKWYTDLGRAVNAGKVFEMLTPEGVLRYVSKEITKAKASYSKKTAGDRKQSKGAVDFINKQAVEKVLNDPKIKKRISSEVKKGKIKQAIDFLEKLKIDTKGKALDVTYGLTAEAWNTLITVVQKGLEAGLTISQAINKGIAGSKTKEFDKDGAKAYLSDQLKDYRVALDPEVAIKEELKAQNDKIDNIIREHYTVVDEKKRSLVDKLVKDANLSEEQAAVVAKDLSNEFDRLTREAKEKALRKYLPKEKSGGKAAKKSLIDTIIEASNVGALSDEQYRDAISEKIGVKSLSAEEAKKITDLASKVQKSKEGFAKSRATQTLLDYISHIEGYSTLDVGMAIWYANILSGLSTQVLNISANFTETMSEAYVTAVTQPQNFGWIFKGLFQGWGRGFLEAMDTMQHGFQPTKFEQKIATSPILERVKFKGGPWNPYNYLKYVSRLMNAADIFFYQGLNEMRSRELAVKTAKKEGKYKADKSVIQRAKEMIYKGEKPWADALAAAKEEGWKGRDLKRRTYEILEQQRPEFLITDSNDAAARGTFNYDPEGTLGALTSLINLASEKVNIGGLKPIKFIVPFTKIISNVANRYLDWTPVGLLRAAKGGIGYETLGENLHRKYTPEERQKVLTKAMTGIIGFTALYALTDDDGPFEITADGTGDTFKNYELQETGWRPYSIKIKGTWYEYKNTPLAIPMATLGYLRDLTKYRGQKDIEAKVSIVLFGTMKYIMDLSFLQSLSSFFDTFSKENSSSADSFFKKAATGTEKTAKSFVIPNAFTQVSRSVQEVADMPVKRANSFGDQLIRDLPVLRDHLGNIYDALGDPVVPNQTERFMPFKPSKSTEEKDKLWTLIADNSAWIGRPGRNTVKPNGATLTDEEYDKFSLLAGKLTKEKLLQSYYYLSQLKDKEEIKKEIGNIKGEARREARDTLFGFEIF